ncbi:SCP-like protein [Ancylostoma caninum]|uniref:SCP-like protein n=1 Tax=Ancylostoma caninum TaxID=29170 RepID=A0A368FQF0_ANCCA|nr:SCP-like protein [Ancylostoma caninum]
MLSVAVLVLCISLSSAEWDCNEKIPIEMRKQIVKYQNDFRQKLLEGEVKGANGKLKPAKFMKNLDWSCDFEKEAESRCRNGIINTNGLQQTGAASDIIVGPGCYPKPLHFNDFKKAMNNWWSQAGGYTDNLFKDRRREEFAQMMNANATKVGCSFEKKGRLTSILCLYNSRVVLGQPFYQKLEA